MSRPLATMLTLALLCGGCDGFLDGGVEVEEETDIDLAWGEPYGAQLGGLQLGAAEDAHVRSTRPDHNYGDATALRVRTARRTSFRTYLKFTVSGVAGPVHGATVALFVLNGSPDGGTLHLTDSSWSEGSLTWHNAPPPGAPVAAAGSVQAGTWVTFDVSGVVTGNGSYSFALVSASGDSAFYSSREGASPPVLVIQAQTDAGVPAPDAGVAPDSGTAAPDSGTPAPDQGTPPAPDQGTPPAPDQGAPDQGPPPAPDQGAPLGAVYHVSPQGSDSNPGTATQPWRSIARVHKQALAPGDQVLFQRGGSWAESLTPPSSGASGKPIVFGAYGSGNRPKITGAPNDGCIQWTQGRSHLVFRDLHLYRCGQPGGNHEGGINVWSTSPSSDIVVEGCLIEEARTWNIYVTGITSLVIRNNTIRNASLEHGIYIDGTLGMDGVVIEDNDISGNAAMCVQFNSNGHSHITGAVLRHNRLHDCKLGAVNNIGAKGLLAHHNLIHGVMPGIYNGCDADAMTKCATGGIYHHNTIVVSGGWTTCMATNQTADFAEFENNVCVSQGSGGNLVENDLGAKGQSDHNLFFGRKVLVWGGTYYSSLASYQAGSGQDSHSTYADPAFVAPGSADFHLGAASPAIDLCASLGYLLDLDGNPMPVGAGADAGCFEAQ